MTESWMDRSENVWLELTGLPLDARPIEEFLSRPDAGAMVVFSGLVRNYSEGVDNVITLDYEAYVPLAAARLREIAKYAMASFDKVRAIAILHRLGPVALSEPSVLVGCSTGHRGAAFEAARYCIDTVKASVPIWKYETSKAKNGWSISAQPIEESVLPPKGKVN